MLYLRSPFYFVSFNIRVNYPIIKLKDKNTIYGILNYVFDKIYFEINSYSFKIIYL